MIYVPGEGESGALNVKGNFHRAPHRGAGVCWQAVAHLRFGSAKDLTALYENAGVTSDKHVITYCGRGNAAATHC